MVQAKNVESIYFRLLHVFAYEIYTDRQNPMVISLCHPLCLIHDHLGQDMRKCILYSS